MDEKLVKSRLQVLKSAAGYYVGRTCHEVGKPDEIEPYSRDSGYHPDEASAQHTLDEMLGKTMTNETGAEAHNGMDFY